MKYACVITNLYDLWEQPRFNSGRVNQLLFGQPVRVAKEKGDYCLVEEPGGYQGWGHRNGLAKITQRDYRVAIRRTNAIVTSSGGARLFGPRTNKQAEPFFIYYGTRLSVTSWRNPYAFTILPNGATYRVKQSRIKPIKTKGEPRLSGHQLVSETKRFLGVPYLWGGITNAGFDCSGLVQTICSRFGIVIPRDTKDQISAGEPIDRDDIATGDLLFFDRHVGFAIGRNRLIHASIAGNGVRVHSLDPESEIYCEDLARTFRQARRIL